MSNAISLRGVGKRFGNLWAVRELDLDVPEGAIYAFLGPNGAGKTTTLRLIAGLLFPDEGTISVLGMHPLDDWIPVRERLSFIPDVPFLYGKLTGAEFLRFVGGIHRIEKQDLDRRIERFVELFSIAQYLPLRMESYSHGTRQKFVVSAAFLSSPSVLLVDEPMVGLDPVSSRVLKDLLRQEADRGVAILLSTHTLSVAQELADFIGMIDSGRLVLSGDRSQLLVDEGEGSLERLFLRITGHI